MLDSARVAMSRGGSAQLIAQYKDISNTNPDFSTLHPAIWRPLVNFIAWSS